MESSKREVFSSLGRHHFWNCLNGRLFRKRPRLKVLYAVIPHSRLEDLQVVPFNAIVVGLIAWGDHLLVLLVNDLVPLGKLQEFPHGVLVC